MASKKIEDLESERRQSKPQRFLDSRDPESWDRMSLILECRARLGHSRKSYKWEKDQIEPLENVKTGAIRAPMEQDNVARRGAKSHGLRKQGLSPPASTSSRAVSKHGSSTPQIAKGPKSTDIAGTSRRLLPCSLLRPEAHWACFGTICRSFSCLLPLFHITSIRM